MGYRLSRIVLTCLLGLCLTLNGPAVSAAGLFGGFGVKDEQELGRKFDVLVRSRMPLIEDPEVKLYVQSIVDRLQKAMPPDRKSVV